MGYETRCAVRVSDAAGTVRSAKDAAVLIESDALIVRGDARVNVPRTSITAVTAKSGVVTITAPNAVIALTLGPDAEKWREKLLEKPKRLIDKLDVKPNATVWLHGIDDAELVAQIRERTARVIGGHAPKACDVAFVPVSSDRQLDAIDRAAKVIAENGAIWVVHPKGKAGVADTTIFARAKALGLTYTKVARISETLSAEKLVWPRASRGK